MKARGLAKFMFGNTLMACFTAASTVSAAETHHDNEFFSLPVPEGWTLFSVDKSPAPPFLGKPDAIFRISVVLQRGGTAEQPLERVIVYATDGSLQLEPGSVGNFDSGVETEQTLELCAGSLTTLFGDKISVAKPFDCDVAALIGRCQAFAMESVGLIGSCAAIAEANGMSAWVLSYQRVADPALSVQHREIRNSIHLKSPPAALAPDKER